MGLYDEGKQKPWHEDPWGALGRLRDKIHGKVGGVADDSQSSLDQRNALNAQGAAAGGFADQSQAGVGALGAEANAARAALRDQAAGKNMLSTEMLRQGLQQQYGQQRSMAAGASPQNQAMAARTGAMNMQRASTGMAGQSALAGIQEQRSAQDALMQSIMAQRGQDMTGALGSRGNAVNAYQVVKPEKSDMEKYGSAVGSGLSMIAMSDKRLKTEIEDGDAKAKSATEKLKAYSYKYKDEKHGKGDQFGPMAQDLEEAGLGHAVIDTPDGKAVHGAKAALSGIALTAALAKRVAKLEGKAK